jgi:hypothetical protein
VVVRGCGRVLAERRRLTDPVTARRRGLWLGSALGAAFVVARVVPFIGARNGIGHDTLDYRASSQLPIWSRAFLGGPRPFGYPLYLKLVAHNEHVAVVGQLIFGTAAWLTLAFFAARATRDPRLRVAAGVVVLAIGSTFEMIQWDRIVGSDALSTACAVAMLAAVLWLCERWTAPRVALVGVLALAATALRDSNGTVFGLVAVVLVIGIVLRRLPLRVITLAALLLVVAVAGSASAGMGRRWEGPLKDVITIRMTNSPERLAYFEREGMPLTPAQVEKVRGHCVSPAPFPDCITLVNPPFYTWIREHGRATYTKALVKFPATTLWEPLAHLRASVGTRLKVEIVLTGEKAPVSKALETVFFARNPTLLAGWAVLMLMLCAVALARRIRGVFAIAAALIALTYPHLWLVCIGGGLEVTRHSLLASVQLRLGLWLSVVWLLDATLDRRRAAPTCD